MNQVSLTIKDSGALSIIRRINVDMNVGIQPEDFDTKHGDGPLTVGEVATINEFGSAAADIPARPWFRGWVGQNGSRTVDQLRNMLAEMVRKQKFDPGPLQVLAQRAQATMLGRIAAGQIKPKNALRTLLGKAPETRPLVDTKQLMSSIHAKVTTRGLLRSFWSFSTRGGAGRS
jgi:hypothetical protein